MSNAINGLMDSSLQNLRKLVDADTVIGEAITTPDGTVIIPVSKVSFGFGGGGVEYGGKTTPAEKNLGGGVSAGVKITPTAFLVVKDGTVRVLPVAVPATSTVDRVVEMVPDLVDKVSAFLRKEKEEKAEEETF